MHVGLSLNIIKYDFVLGSDTFYLYLGPVGTKIGKVLEVCDIGAVVIQKIAVHRIVFFLILLQITILAIIISTYNA